MPGETSSDEEFAAMLQRQVCAAFDVEPWELGLEPAPWRVRLLAPLHWRWWWWRIRRTWYRLTYRESTDDEW